MRARSGDNPMIHTGQAEAIETERFERPDRAKLHGHGALLSTQMETVFRSWTAIVMWPNP
jgi:hypothetical protein